MRKWKITEYKSLVRGHRVRMWKSRTWVKLSVSRNHTDLCHCHTHRFSSSRWARIFSSSPLLPVAMLCGACCLKAGSRSVTGLECRSRYWSSSLCACGERKEGPGIEQGNSSGCEFSAPSSSPKRPPNLPVFKWLLVISTEVTYAFIAQCQHPLEVLLCNHLDVLLVFGVPFLFSLPPIRCEVFTASTSKLFPIQSFF